MSKTQTTSIKSSHKKTNDNDASRNVFPRDVAWSRERRDHILDIIDSIFDAPIGLSSNARRQNFT